MIYSNRVPSATLLYLISSALLTSAQPWGPQSRPTNGPASSSSTTTSVAVVTSKAVSSKVVVSSVVATSAVGSSVVGTAAPGASATGSTSLGSTTLDETSGSSSSSSSGSGPWCITIDGPSGMTCEANGGGYTDCTVGKQMCVSGGGAGGKIQLIAPGGKVGDVGTQIEPYFPAANGAAQKWNIDISYVNGYNYDVSCTGDGVNIGSTSGSLWTSASANNHGCTGAGTSFIAASGICSNVNGGALSDPKQAPAFFQSQGSALTGTYLAANQRDPGAFITTASASITCKARGGYPGSSSSKRDGDSLVRRVGHGLGAVSSRLHARGLIGSIDGAKR